MGEWNVANFSKIIRPIRATLAPGAHLPWRAVPGSAGVRVENSSVEDSIIAITTNLPPPDTSWVELPNFKANQPVGKC